jgi:hypothetical protein
MFLTVDYTIEAFYCWLIEKLTHASYSHEPADTYAWIGNANEMLFQQVPQVKKVRQAGPQAFIVNIPRYQEFTTVASRLAQGNAYFVEIAGNSQVIVSILVPDSWHYERADAQQLFSTPILTNPELKRLVISCDVTSLHAMLNALTADGVRVEHVYDY